MSGQCVEPFHRVNRDGLTGKRKFLPALAAAECLPQACIVEAIASAALRTRGNQAAFIHTNSHSHSQVPPNYRLRFSSGLRLRQLFPAALFSNQQQFRAVGDRQGYDQRVAPSILSPQSNGLPAEHIHGLYLFAFHAADPNAK